jgi:hypothetical protein
MSGDSLAAAMWATETTTAAAKELEIGMDWLDWLVGHVGLL